MVMKSAQASVGFITRVAAALLGAIAIALLPRQRVTSDERRVNYAHR